MILINIVTSIIILFFTFKLSLVISNRYNGKKEFTYLIVVWHTFLSLTYYLLNFIIRMDAQRYYSYSIFGDKGIYNSSNFYEINLGANFLYEFIRGITTFFYLDFLSLFLLFNLFGTIGLVLIYLKYISVLKKNKLNYFLLFVIIFLPSMSFWSSAPGKDAISFLIISASLFCINKKYYFIYLPLLSILMFVIRPHIGFVLILSFLILFFLRIKLKLVIKLFLIIISLFLFSFIFDYVISFINFNNEISLKGISDFITNRSYATYIGETKIYLFESNFLIKIYHYLFTPSLFNFKFTNLIYLFQSIENTILMAIIFLIIIKIIFQLSKTKKIFFKIFDTENIYILIFSLIILFVLSQTTFNSGIATRQKYIFIPLVFFFLLKLLNLEKK